MQSAYASGRQHVIVAGVEDNSNYDYTAPAESKGRRGFGMLKLAASWTVAIAIAIALQQFVFQSYQVFGQSMEPTLHENDYLIISKLGASWADVKNTDYTPERGDIIVFNSGGTRLIKRVIGLPGETIVVENGDLQVYNQQFPDGFNPYETLPVPDITISGEGSTTVPAGQVFVVGDNRENGNSFDSRSNLGPVPTEDIIGVLVLRLWPVGDFKTF